jgi:hypothetical protein
MGINAECLWAGSISYDEKQILTVRDWLLYLNNFEVERLT